MRDALKNRLQKAHRDGVFTAGVLGSISATGEAIVISVGEYDGGGKRMQVTADTIFDVASITKAIPVSSLALYLIDRGELTLDMSVASILPEFRTTYRDEVTIRHLLTQTLDYRTSLAGITLKSAEALREYILTTKFIDKPGLKMNYTNATSIVLGMVIEVISQKRLDQFADEVFFKPLGMTRTSFHPEMFPKDMIAPTEDDPKRNRFIHGEVHDESASVLRSIMIPGSAGLFSSVPDLLIFMQMIIRKGDYKSRRYFSEHMIHLMPMNQLVDIGEKIGLGWEIMQPQYMGRYVSEQTIGKTGFTGCVVIGDIAQGKAMVLLTNFHFPKRKESFKALHELRRDLSDIVFHS